MEGSVKDWVKESMVRLVRGAAGRKVRELLRASVPVRLRRAKWFAMMSARVGPILVVWE